jgi:Zn-dependent peptidase ImmA (M78 family)
MLPKKDETSVELTTPDFKKKLASLYSYLVAHLQLRETPKLKLVTNKKNSDDILGYTGYYDNKKKQIVAYTTDRHPKDILRTVAHEIIHHWQNEHGCLNSQSNSNDPQYAQHDPNMRKMEMQAYLLGNILFRDWSDIYKYGNNTYSTGSSNTR